MKKVSLVAGVGLIAATLLASCTPAVVTEVGVGYGLTHAHYVGMVTVTTEDDVVTEISFEEYFLPYSWAKVTATEGTDHTVAVVTTSRTTNLPVTTIYAHKVKIGTRIFTIEVTGEPGSQTFKYASEGIDNIDTWMATEANAKWYVERIDANDFGFVDAEGNAITTFAKADTYAKIAMTKSASGYWTVAAPGLGWTGNMAALEAMMVGSTMDFDPADFTKSTTAPLVWGNGEITTGATLSDFKDYVAVALRAYANRVVL